MQALLGYQRTHVFGNMLMVTVELYVRDADCGGALQEAIYSF